MSTAEPLMNHNVDSEFVGILVAVLAIIITIVLFALWRRRKSIGNRILLTGLSDAGKTLIFARLVCSKFVKTYTSAKENMEDIVVNNHTLKLVDIPGHERLRYKYFDQFKSSTKGVIYVINSVSIQKDIRDVAEYLYNILSDPCMQNKFMLILCNKQDQTMARGCSVIKVLLEREIDLLRMTKTNQLQATDASSANVFLGEEGEVFEFAQLDTQLDFAECNAFNKDPDTPADIEQLNAWLKKIA